MQADQLWELAALLFGLCVGSFLNVLALRTLAEKSLLWPPSHCPRCQHRLGIADNIPLLSWIFLQGRCRYCAGAISWQYPVVEAFTGFIFWAIVHVYLNVTQSPFNSPYWNRLLGTFTIGAPQQFLEYNGWVISPDALRPYIQQPLSPDVLSGGATMTFPWLAVGALFLAATLIAVTITDFREKLIPHDITYPAMLVGIVFSGVVRHDLLGSMAGIGASYILFDFIAFYGLKVYLSAHGGTPQGRARRLKRKLGRGIRRRLPRALRWRLDLATIETVSVEEPMEVMGGGDAVLAAVMAAFLGWQLLCVSLILGFLLGTIMGLFLLIIEMSKANLLHKCLRRTALFGLIGATTMGLLGIVLSRLITIPDAAMALPMALLGACAGTLLAVVSVGTQVSRPYPFGPALAAGGFMAIFLLPNWVYLSAISPSAH